MKYKRFDTVSDSLLNSISNSSAEYSKLQNLTAVFRDWIHFTDLQVLSPGQLQNDDFRIQRNTTLHHPAPPVDHDSSLKHFSRRQTANSTAPTTQFCSITILKATSL